MVNSRTRSDHDWMEIPPNVSDDDVPNNQPKNLSSFILVGFIICNKLKCLVIFHKIFQRLVPIIAGWMCKEQELGTKVELIVRVPIEIVRIEH